MPARKLSIDQEIRIIEFYCSHDESIRSVASRFNTTYDVVAYALRKHQIPRVRGRAKGPMLHRRIYPTSDQKALMLRRWQEGASVDLLSREIGAHTRVIKRWLEEQGIIFEARPARREQKANWKGGRFVTHYGYIMVALSADEQEKYQRPGKTQPWYMLEHRLIMSKSLQRPLHKEEHVHHINGDRTDNRIENLQLRTHYHGTGVRLCCQDCGSVNIVECEL